MWGAHEALTLLLRDTKPILRGKKIIKKRLFCSLPHPGSHALFLRIVAGGYLKMRYVHPTFKLCACLITTLCLYIAPRKISFDSKPDDSKQKLWILRSKRTNRRWPIWTKMMLFALCTHIKSNILLGNCLVVKRQRLNKRWTIKEGVESSRNNIITWSWIIWGICQNFT